MLTKAISIALAVALIALASLGLIYRAEVRAGATTRAELQTAKDALNGVAKQRKQDVATVAAWQKKNASTGRKLAEARQALQTALQGEKAWSDTQVPPAVIEALAGPSERSNHADK
jgi:hypothetical protein